jgi:tRNA 5-methylaminomethyl-2-thiouridine biosynthesis bifunctional protein
MIQKGEMARNTEQKNFLNSHFVASAACISDADGLPFSQHFADRYFSAQGGYEEAVHVFLQGNELTSRWNDGCCWTVAELGFGSGLNFLATWKAWQDAGLRNALLHYISFEQYPFEPAQLAAVLAHFPQLQTRCERLLELLPPPISGFHRRWPAADLSLTLVYGDANDYLPLLSGMVDCWFLDGFSPAKNPELWNPRILKEIFDRSHSRTTLATYSVSSALRRNFSALGASVEKRPGFGKKKEMLRVSFPARQEAQPVLQQSERRVLILGAGLAGTACAAAFAERGWAVEILDKEQAPALRGSGNSAGVLMPHLSIKPDLLSRFCLGAYEYAVAQIRDYHRAGCRIRGEFCGVLRFLSSPRLEKLAENLPALGLPPQVARLLSAQACAERLGLSTRCGGIYFEEGGWVHPPDVCRAHLQRWKHSIRLRTNITVQIIRRRDGQWQALGAEDELLAEAPVLVIAGGYECLQLAQTAWLPLESVRGQVLQAAANERSEKLNTVLCYDGYVLPAWDGRHFLGATFDHENDSEQISEAQNAELYARLHEWIPDFPLASSSYESSRVSFRAMSRDRLPLVGVLPDPQEFQADNGPSEQKKGLYVSLGHGSRGLTTCPLAAEIIAALAGNEVLPVENDIAAALAPERFLRRILQRGLPLSAENLDSLKVPHLRRKGGER